MASRNNAAIAGIALVIASSLPTAAQEAPAAAQDFPTPQVGMKIQLNQVERGYQNVRQQHDIIGVNGDMINFQLEGSIDGRVNPTVNWSMRFLFKELGRYQTSVNDCKITSGAEQLKTIAVGATVDYRTTCRLTQDGRVAYTATQKIQRKITGKESIKVAAGTFETVVMEEKIDSEIDQNGRKTNKTDFKKYWLAPSIGYYVRSTEWDQTVTGKPPFRMEAAQVR